MKNLLALLCLVCAVIPGQTADPARRPRPPVGVPTDAVHFNGKWYRLYPEKTTWRRANEKCRTLGGQLAIIPDKPTQAFIQELSKGLEVWLGATDEKNEGIWVWLDGTEMKYQAWGKGQPGGRERENFLALGWRGTRWFDAHDQWPCTGFICEWKSR